MAHDPAVGMTGWCVWDDVAARQVTPHVFVMKQAAEGMILLLQDDRLVVKEVPPKE